MHSFQATYLDSTGYAFMLILILILGPAIANHFLAMCKIKYQSFTSYMPTIRYCKPSKQDTNISNASHPEVTSKRFGHVPIIISVAPTPTQFAFFFSFVFLRTLFTQVLYLPTYLGNKVGQGIGFTDCFEGLPVLSGIDDVLRSRSTLEASLGGCKQCMRHFFLGVHSYRARSVRVCTPDE